jgi:hypothetical protein
MLPVLDVVIGIVFVFLKEEGNRQGILQRYRFNKIGVNKS